ncbi:MAG: leucine-rich repeat protein [Alistipes sp.]|nr:leucine-rich repeat protein [Alistipes sp.]
MKKLFLLLALFSMLAVGCEELFPTEQSPNATPVFSTDGESSYIVDAEGEEITVMVTTNIDYSVVIPEDAEEWLSVADTRAVIREETLTFIVAENKAYDRRSTTVTLVDNEGNVLQAIEFIQRAAAMPQSACPSDEIWYTNDSTTEPTKPYKTDVFGANIVSNTYSEDSERWVIKFYGDVTTIGEGAFAYCSSLASVTIPDSVTTIGQYAFHSCSSLTSVTIPDSVTTIGEGAFAYCSSLASVTIPDSVTTIGQYAFYSCDSLTSITIPDSVTTIGNNAFYDCNKLTSVTIGDSVTTIGEAAFYECDSLTSVTIGDSVTTIENNAFNACSSLTSVTIPDSVTTIGGRAFQYCGSLTSVTIPDSVTSIGYAAFCACYSLTSITIPDSVTSIGNGAFAWCSSLQEFKGKYASEDGRCLIVDGVFNSFANGCGATEYTIPDSVTTIGDDAFYCCSSLRSVTIGDSVTTIGDRAFHNCSSLTNVTIGDSVTTIGDWTFGNCDNLTSVTIGDSVTTIGSSAFQSCSSLTSITIPDSVTSIGESAFGYCGSLTSVYCKAITPPALGSYVFDNNDYGRKIYVPMKSVDAYKSAWSKYSSAIVGYDF